MANMRDYVTPGQTVEFVKCCLGVGNKDSYSSHAQKVVESYGNGHSMIVFTDGTRCADPTDFKVVSGPGGPVLLEESKSTKQENTSMSAASNLRDAKLTADERYARYNNLKNPDGMLTDDGIALLNRYLWDKNETDIIAAAREAQKTVAQNNADDVAATAPTTEA